MNKQKKKPEADDDENFGLHTMAEACEILRCSKKKIAELGRDGRLEIVKLDCTNRVTDRSLQRLLSQIFGGGAPPS